MIKPATGLCLALLAGLATGATACRAGDAPAQGGTTAPPAAVDLRTLPPSAGGGGAPHEMPKPGVPDPRPRLIRDAKLDLGRRLGIDIGEIGVTSVTPVTWPNAALGCPRPGRVYTQALVPGYRIVLSARGREFTYHTDSARRIVACP